MKKSPNTQVRRNGSAARATKQGKNRRLAYSGELLAGNPPSPTPALPGRSLSSKEFKVVALRDCLPPDEMQFCDCPASAVNYWRRNIQNAPHFDPERECLVVLILNVRRRIKGHVLQSIGTNDTMLLRLCEVFRAAVIAAGMAIIILHNHPTGDPSPSEADIEVTRDLIRGGRLLKIDVFDSIIIGHPEAASGKGYASLREMGYFNF